MRPQRHIAASIVALGLLAAAPRAVGQPAPDAEARASLIREVREAHLAGDHQRALDLAEHASALGATGTLHGLVARELVDLSRFAEALAQVGLCARDAPLEPASAHRDAILGWCQTQIRELERRVARVVVEAPAPPTGLVVTVDGRPLPPALLGGGYAVDPGRVVVTATAPGYEPFRREVDAPGGASVAVPIVLTTIEPDAPPQVATRTRSPVGLVVAAVGAACLISSAITWAMADGMCGPDPSACPSGCCVASEDLVQSIRARDTATTATLITGAGLTAAGALLYLFLRPTARTGPRVTVSVGSSTLGLTGAF